MRSLCTIWIFVELNFYDYKVDKEVFVGPHCLDKLEDYGYYNHKQDQEIVIECGCMQGTLKESDIHP